MDRKLQGANALLIDTQPDRIWAVLEDPARLPEYMRAVKHVDAGGAPERLGETRSCQVEMEGKRGEVVERCVELVPNERLTYVMEEDAFGFSRLFADFGFSYVLEPRGAGRTLVRMEGFYREKSLLSRLLNALMMKRKLGKLRSTILADLKSVVEGSNEPSLLRPTEAAGGARGQTAAEL